MERAAAAEEQAAVLQRRCDQLLVQREGMAAALPYLPGVGCPPCPSGWDPLQLGYCPCLQSLHMLSCCKKSPGALTAALAVCCHAQDALGAPLRQLGTGGFGAVAEHRLTLKAAVKKVSPLAPALEAICMAACQGAQHLQRYNSLPCMPHT
jgi:hypothetical protein